MPKIVRVTVSQDIKHTVMYQSFGFQASITADLEEGDDVDEVLEDLREKVRTAVYDAASAEQSKNARYRLGFKQQRDDDLKKLQARQRKIDAREGDEDGE